MTALEAFHRNWVGLFKTLPAYYAPAKFWREDGIAIGITGLRLESFNGAILDEAYTLTSSKLDDIELRFAQERIQFSIQVFSQSHLYPGHNWMLQHNYVELFTDPLMIFDGPMPAAPVTPGLEVAFVEEDDADGFAQYRESYIAGFGLPPVFEHFFEVMTLLPTSRRVIARWDGKPVGSGLLMYLDGTAGVYNLTTIPTTRRKGIGAAMMRKLHEQALSEGFPGTVLASSEMGLPLYRALGYRQEGYQHMYVPLTQTEDVVEPFA